MKPRTTCTLMTTFLVISHLNLSGAPDSGSLARRIESAKPRVVLADGDEAPPGLTVAVSAAGPFRRAVLTNRSATARAIREVILFDGEHGWPADTPWHGESFNMFGGVIGTLEAPVDVDPYTDRGHYKLPEMPGMRTVYGVMIVTPANAPAVVLGFTSCRRFTGQFRVGAARLQIVLPTEGLTLEPGESWPLEEWVLLSGPDREHLLEQLADRINDHHPRLPWPRLPTGWCSWYCFGPQVNAQNVRDNLAAFHEHLPGGIRFIQIDDGYQPWMGDWLETNDQFKGGLTNLLIEIQSAGFEPALWVAPFIASPQSRLFREHPEWFVRTDQGQPLRSDQVTFGGWRQGPWYMLDGTHPGAQQYLETVFRTMASWGVTYFKLDANLWGALPFGRRHDRLASSVEAYRRGMAAVRRGAGDAFLLGCNHPLWPSLGEIHGSRSSMDVQRSWSGFTRVARENLLRNWQNNRLWWNDPDCLLLTADLPAQENRFHWITTYASGGMVLSGDDASRYSAEQWALLRRAAEHPGAAARFADLSLQTGIIPQDKGWLAVFLNWDDQPGRRTVRFPETVQTRDAFTGEDLGVHRETLTLESLPGRSARLIQLTPIP